MNIEEQHPDRFAPTPLARGELKATAINNSPSSLKGWQSKTDGVDASGRVYPLGGRGSSNRNTTS